MESFVNITKNKPKAKQAKPVEELVAIVQEVKPAEEPIRLNADEVRNRKRGRGKIKIVKRNHVDNKELVREMLMFKQTILDETEKKNKQIAALEQQLKGVKRTEATKKEVAKLQKKIDDLKAKKCFGRASERLGEIFMDLVENYATKTNFSGYTYLEEMKSRGIFFLLRYSAKSFDPEKSKNAFAYCTQIVKNAFIQVIKKEKKRAVAKKAYVENYLRNVDYYKKDDDLIS